MLALANTIKCVIKSNEFAIETRQGQDTETTKKESFVMERS